MTKFYHLGAYTQKTPYSTTEILAHPCLLILYFDIKEMQRA